MHWSGPRLKIVCLHNINLISEFENAVLLFVILPFLYSIAQILSFLCVVCPFTLKRQIYESRVSNFLSPDTQVDGDISSVYPAALCACGGSVVVG
jgi:hypothetical protein